MWQLDPESIKDLAAGGGGSLIAAWLSKTTGMQFCIMVAAGWIVASILGPMMANLFKLDHQQSGVGFMVGFLAIVVLNKVFEGVNSIPAGSVGSVFLQWLKKRLGVDETPRS